jgi:hypothetical protein
LICTRYRDFFKDLYLPSLLFERPLASSLPVNLSWISITCCNIPSLYARHASLAPILLMPVYFLGNVILEFILINILVKSEYHHYLYIAIMYVACVFQRWKHYVMWNTMTRVLVLPWPVTRTYLIKKLPIWLMFETTHIFFKPSIIYPPKLDL